MPRRQELNIEISNTRELLKICPLNSPLGKSLLRKEANLMAELRNLPHYH